LKSRSFLASTPLFKLCRFYPSTQPTQQESFADFRKQVAMTSAEEFEKAMQGLGVELVRISSAFTVSSAAFEWTTEGKAHERIKDMDEQTLRRQVKFALDAWFKGAEGVKNVD
jgi:hypothetical protein